MQNVLQEGGKQEPGKEQKVGEQGKCSRETDMSLATRTDTDRGGRALPWALDFSEVSVVGGINFSLTIRG